MYKINTHVIPLNENFEIDANDYINYRNAKEYKPSGNASYYGTRSVKTNSNEYMYVWISGNITYTTSSNSDLEVCFAGCI